MAQKTHKDCKNCGKPFKLYRTTDICCSSYCYSQFKGSKPTKPRTAIKKVSDKRVVEKLQYDSDRIIYLAKPENKLCQIKGPTCTKFATTIEHTRGRVGFADNAKREAGVSLYLDKDYWKPSCFNCNGELENNPELSREHQLSKIHGGKKIK